MSRTSIIALIMLLALVEIKAQIISPQLTPPYKLQTLFPSSVGEIKPLGQVQYRFKNSTWSEYSKVNYRWEPNALTIEHMWLSDTGYRVNSERNYVYDNVGNVIHYNSYMYNEGVRYTWENNDLFYKEGSLDSVAIIRFNMITYNPLDSVLLDNKYYYTEMGEVEKIITSKEGTEFQMFQYTYDENRKITNADTLNNVNGEFVKQRGSEYTYSQSGNLLKEVSTSYKNGQITSVLQTVYDYDTDNNFVLKMYSYGTDPENLKIWGSTTYTYDPTGKVVEVKEYEFTATDKYWNSRTTYSYSETSIEEIQYMQNLITHEEKPVIKWVTTLQGGTSVAGEVSIPQSLSLEPYPNPLQENSTVAFAISTDASLKITLHDILGNEIGELCNGFKTSGSYSIPFEKGNLTSGTYFLKMNVNGQIITKSIIITQ